MQPGQTSEESHVKTENKERQTARLGPSEEYEIVNGKFAPLHPTEGVQDSTLPKLQIVAGVLRKIPSHQFQVDSIRGEYLRDNKLFYRVVVAEDSTTCFVPAEQLCNEYNYSDMVVEYIGRGRVVWKWNEDWLLRPTGTP